LDIAKALKLAVMKACGTAGQLVDALVVTMAAMKAVQLVAKLVEK
jgi:hypothetical protein